MLLAIHERVKESSQKDELVSELVRITVEQVLKPPD